jgi:hypothetical protein
MQLDFLSALRVIFSFLIYAQRYLYSLQISQVEGRSIKPYIDEMYSLDVSNTFNVASYN